MRSTRAQARAHRRQGTCSQGPLLRLAPLHPICDESAGNDPERKRHRQSTTHYFRPLRYSGDKEGIDF